MKGITLATLTLAAALVATGAGTVPAVFAQDPVPPTPPAAPPRVKPVPAPTPAPRALRGVDLDLIDAQREFGRIDRETAQALRETTRETMRIDREAAEAAREATRESTRDALRSTREALDASRVAMSDMNFTPMAPMVAIAPLPPMPAMAPMSGFIEYGDRFSSDERFHMPPAPWAQGDPADSVYRQARNALNGGEYGRAAKLFADISKNYPKSAYASDAAYFEAMARYKIGTTDELKQAAKILEPIASKSGGISGATSLRPAGFVDMRRNSSEADVSALYLRINGQLAQRGDRDAAAIVSKAASTPGATCDQDDIDVRTQALNALSQMDPAGAAPAIRHVLESKDECTVPLRRSAVFMLARRGDAESSTLLMQVAKSDPSVNVRTEAIQYLSRIPGDVGLNALDEMMRTEQDERIQRAAVHALMSSDNTKARASMRSLIDRKDAPIALRIEAVNSFNSERATPDDAKYLRDLYGRADNDRLKAAIIDAVSRIGGTENEQWVLAIARNPNEPAALQATALGRAARLSNIAIADLVKFYDTADSRDKRRVLINIFSMRKEPEATDKLIDIVKTGTDLSLRTQAINALQRKNDPRTAQLLKDILDGKRS